MELGHDRGALVQLERDRRWWSCRLGQPFPTVRERLRDTYREARAKAGAHRTELGLSSCWAPWLDWVLEGWSGTPLAIALDATILGQRFALLVISVLYRGCAVPIRWKVLPAGVKHPWQPEWLALLKAVRGRVPPTWTVLALADRGLYAKWLFEPSSVSAGARCCGSMPGARSGRQAGITATP